MAIPWYTPPIDNDIDADRIRLAYDNLRHVVDAFYSGREVMLPIGIADIYAILHVAKKAILDKATPTVCEYVSTQDVENHQCQCAVAATQSDEEAADDIVRNAYFKLGQALERLRANGISTDDITNYDDMA